MTPENITFKEYIKQTEHGVQQLFNSLNFYQKLIKEIDNPYNDMS